MFIYYLTISVLTGLGYILTEKKKETRATIFYLIAAFLILTFLTSFRYAIGFDYFSYQNIYKTISEWTLGDIFRSYWHEPLFFVVCKFFSLLGCSFPIFLLIINLFLLFTAMQFIYHYSKLPWISVYLYITLQFLAYDMNLIRQAFAVSFFLLSYPYLKNRKIVFYTIFIFLGGLFHNSLLFMWFLYFLLPKKISKKLFGAILAFTIFMYFLFDPLFYLMQPLIPEKYVYYLGEYFWNSNGFAYVIPSALYGIFIYLFRNQITEPDKRSIYLNSALYNFLITLFITKHFILERFSIYPFALSLIAIPEIIYSYQNIQKANEKHKLTYHHVLFLFLLYGGAYFLFAVIKGFHHVYPYVSLLAKSYSAPN